MSSEMNADSETEGNVRRSRRGGVVTYQNRSMFVHDIEGFMKLVRATRLYEQVFSIPLILKEILKYLEKKDLLSTSLINKNWNFFSREVLRESTTCPLVFRRTCACRNLRKLNGFLLNSENVPYNGISMMSLMYSNKCGPGPDLNEMVENFLGKISIKNLTISFQGERNIIPCVRTFIREIFQKNTLEELSVSHVPSFTQSFAEIFGLDPVGQWLPNVRTLKGPFSLDDFNIVPRNVFKDLVEASPKVEKLYGKIESEWLEFIMPLNLAKAVKEYFFSLSLKTLRNSLAFAVENPKLEKLLFSLVEDEDEEMFCEWEVSCQNDVASMLKQLLNSSKESLTRLAIGHSEIILVTHQWNVPAFEKVTHLSLSYCPDVDAAEGYNTLRKVNWPKYFPSLEEVSVDDIVSPDLHDFNDFYIGDTFRASPSQFTCDSVTKFCLMWLGEPLSEHAQQIRTFRSIFPNVKEFYLSDRSRNGDLFVPFLEELWSAWEDLEDIIMAVDRGPSGANYDSAFLGISNEEVAHLLETVTEFESLEIVATKPSIFNLPKLKKIVMHFGHGNDPCVSNAETPNAFFLSRLVGQCGFARVPGLVVELFPDYCDEDPDDCELPLRQIEPYAHVATCEMLTSECDIRLHF